MFKQFSGNRCISGRAPGLLPKWSFRNRQQILVRQKKNSSISSTASSSAYFYEALNKPIVRIIINKLDDAFTVTLLAGILPDFVFFGVQ